MPLAQALNTGSLAWSTCTGIAYWYMVASWGGYSFVINIIPIHALVCVLTGRLSGRLYVAFAPFIVMGTLEAGERCWRHHLCDTARVQPCSDPDHMRNPLCGRLHFRRNAQGQAGCLSIVLMYRGSIPQSCFWKDIGCLLRCVPHPHAASIPVVGFNAVLTSEHFGAFFTFAVLHAALAIRYIKVFAAWQSSPALGQNLDVMRLQAIKLFSTSGSQDVGHCKTTHEVVRCSQCLRPALGTAATL